MRLRALWPTFNIWLRPSAGFALHILQATQAVTFYAHFLFDLALACTRLSLDFKFYGLTICKMRAHCDACFFIWLKSSSGFSPEARVAKCQIFHTNTEINLYPNYFAFFLPLFTQIYFQHIYIFTLIFYHTDIFFHADIHLTLIYLLHVDIYLTRIYPQNL